MKNRLRFAHLNLRHVYWLISEQGEVLFASVGHTVLYEYSTLFYIINLPAIKKLMKSKFSQGQIYHNFWISGF